MSISLSFIRVLFLIICVLFSVTFTTQNLEGGLNLINAAVGLLGGIAFAGLLVGSDFVFKRFNLRSFNTAILGLFCGYLMAQAILFILTGVTGIESSAAALTPIRFFVYLFCAYLGMVMTARAAEELHVSIPFVEFKAMGHKKKDVLVDVSVLMDPRIIDLASSGLLDHHLIIPRFAIKDMYAQAESNDEAVKAKARRSLEVIKKLESLPALDLRYVDTDFPEIKEPMTKLIRLARFLDTNIITSDINRIQQSSIEGVRIINIHMLSNALKPITQAGEVINIKIQRYGKEARQGVGYLEDGTMVVVNGGAEFIGETIKGHVLSVKHTSSGRMIFCNASEEGSLLTEQDFAHTLSDLESSHKNYLAL
ncbi:conserved putative membrane protein [Candidatus Protochlamydia naegleriophila]|uniref:Conserved putative membrane protein n=1 Tax=Candidatus Protochlamydia naegleriophila TaxID=389348 RepID=A0A0U5ER16_9BACT|nr:TRAM domain-containing protein [Candidatus Protochlamydia naegleriophila]CUI16545.1 conserved putative membrane protein [Candidatus Protochlamydia naegleriophila]